MEHIETIATINDEWDLPEMKQTFSEIGFRYPNRDATGWYENTQLLRDRYGSWDGLLAASDHDAVQLTTTTQSGSSGPSTARHMASTRS